PETLIAKDREEYITATLSLTDSPRLRERLQKLLMENDVEKVLFEGRSEAFAERVWQLWNDSKQRKAELNK
ncbi:TPA: cobalt ABC transporter permease, partial [Escherichia coli]|nr:cobalt ABC transporter permease [Escherichia coli]